MPCCLKFVDTARIYEFSVRMNTFAQYFRCLMKEIRSLFRTIFYIPISKADMLILKSGSEIFKPVYDPQITEFEQGNN